MFLEAFDPIIVDGSTHAYKGTSPEIQSKMRRVFEVWRSRQVLRPQVLEELERSLDGTSHHLPMIPHTNPTPDIDRTRSSKKPLGQLGGSLFSNSSLPPDLKPVEPLATSLHKADLAAKPALTSAHQDYDKLTSPSASIPTPPMHAAALAALVKKLALAENAVADSIKARTALVSGLEALLQTTRSKLAADEAQLTDLASRKLAIETRKSEVEAAILQGLSAAETNKISAAPLPSLSERPRIEELTPPPMESFTPVGSPTLPATNLPSVPDDVLPEAVSHPVEPVAVAPPANEDPSTQTPETRIGEVNTVPGADLLNALAKAQGKAGENGVYGAQTFKKRKMSRSAAEDEFAVFEGDAAMNSIDSTLGDLV